MGESVCMRGNGHACCEFRHSIHVESVFPVRESGAGFRWCVTGSRRCNGAALPWFLVSRRSANWGLSGVSAKSQTTPVAIVQPSVT